MPVFFRFLISVLLLAFTIGFYVPSAMSRVIIKEKTKYYDVKGKTGREIFQSMLQNGPKIGKGLRNHALATTEYKYDIKNVNTEVRNGRCIAKNLDLHLTVTYTYPRWRGNNRARSTTRNAWRSFLSAVTWHEKQHVRIAREYAEEYVSLLKTTRLRTSQQCNTDGFSRHWRASRAALKHNRKQKQFDRMDLRKGGRGYEAQIALINAR